MESFKETLEADISEQLPTLSGEDVQSLLQKVLEVVECIEDLPHVEPPDLQPPLKKATAKRFVTFLQTKYGDLGEPKKKVELQPASNVDRLAKPTGNKPKVPTKPTMKSLKIPPKLFPKPKSTMPSPHESPRTVRPLRTHPAWKPNSDNDARFPSISDDTCSKLSAINIKASVAIRMTTTKMEDDVFASAASSNSAIQKGIMTKSKQKASREMAKSEDLSVAQLKHLTKTVTSLAGSQALRMKRRPCILPHRKESDDGNNESSESEQIEGTELRLLPLQAVSAELKGSPSDSNDVDDGDDLTRVILPPYKVHSFSVGQMDLVSKGNHLDRLRPSSVENERGSRGPEKDHAGTEAAIGNDITSFDEEPIYTQLYESAILQPNTNVSYVNDDDDDDFWGSDEFDSDEFSEEDSMDGINQDESSPAEKQARKAGRRKQIVTELLTTERAYVKRLYLIDQEFHLKTVIENGSHHMFPDDVIPQMFSNINSIYQFHNDFLLPQLEKRIQDWDNTPKIGDVMSKFAPFLKLYSEYAKNFDHASKTINKWQQRSTRFADLLSEHQKKPECGKLSLQHHMLEPIQRVPRYEMLLKDYLNHLEEGSEDRPDTEKALELVNTAAAHANQMLAKPEKFWRLLELNEMFRWHSGGAVDLTDIPRQLIKDGQIFKRSARNGKQIARHLFLFTDMLLICTDSRKLGSYHVHNFLKVDSMQVVEGDNPDTPFTFDVETNSKTVELQGRTQKEKLEWFSAIQSVIKDRPRLQQSTETDHRLGHCAPKWVKDQKASECMVCASIFSIIKRRHHCRCCGIVVCGECSSHKVPLPYQENKPDRVCDKCYAALTLQTDELQVKGSDPSVVSGMILMSSDKKIWERRWFALHKTFVLYSFQSPQDMQALTSTLLPGYVVSEATEEDHIDKKHVIKISRPDDTILMYIHSPDCWIKWLIALQRAVYEEFPPKYAVKKEAS